MKENKIYDAEEVKRIHDKRNLEKQEARDAKRDVAVHMLASSITRSLKKSNRSYLQLKSSRIKRKLGRCDYLRYLEECLREYGYEIRRIRVKEKPWWSHKTIEVNYLLIGYDKGYMDIICNGLESDNE